MPKKRSSLSQDSDIPEKARRQQTVVVNTEQQLDGVPANHDSNSNNIAEDEHQPIHKGKYTDYKDTVNIAVASRALFDLDEEHDIYHNQGLQQYLEFQVSKENVPLRPGSAFPFIKALRYVNDCLKKINKDQENLFSVVLMSHNHAKTGIRLTRSLEYHNLDIQRVCLTAGTNPVGYLAGYNIHLYLTSYPEEVEQALAKGVAAAAIFNQTIENPVEDQFRIAFDLDAVLFSLDSDNVCNTKGFEAYVQHEQKHVDAPIPEGPLKEFASAIGAMQKTFSKHEDIFPRNPIRTYIVTARSACVSERPLKTLRAWGLEVDEMHFLAGGSKGPVLQAIKPHIFFDDSVTNIHSAQEFGAPAAHVKYGAAGFNPQPKTTAGNGTGSLSKQMSFYNDTG